MPNCLIALGSNVGRRRRYLEESLRRLADHPQIWPLQVSDWHTTRPIGGPADQPPFLNGAVRARTHLDPYQLWGQMQAVEVALGRFAGPAGAERWGPRTIDLDLLLFDDLVLDDPQLTIPHPRMVWRPFVLEPAVEVAAEMIHPATGWTVRQLWWHLNSARPYFAVTGGDFKQRREICDLVAQQIAVQLLSAQDWGLASAGPAPKAIRPGLTEAYRVECLQRLATRFTEIWSDRPDRPILSDFWVGELFALSATRGDIDWPTWYRLERTIPAPKLIIVLGERQTAGPGTRGSSGTRSGLVEQGPVVGHGGQVALHDLIRQLVAGPKLFLDPRDSQWAAEEIVAAVLAMEERHHGESPAHL